MIICPNCKEEIDDDSRFCDQCGQALLYCSSCGRVGLGHRCTHCGGLMISYDELQKKREERNNMTSLSTSFVSQSVSIGQATKGNMETIPNDVPQIKGMPMLLLYNSSLAIRIVGVNGAVIGRKILQQQHVCIGCSCPTALQTRFWMVCHRQAFFKRNEAEPTGSVARCADVC